VASDGRSATADWALFFLRIAVGVLFMVYGLPKFTHLAGLGAMWARQWRLPGGGVVGVLQAAVEFGGGACLILGLATRLFGLLLAVDMAGALLLVRIPHSAFQGGWALEWQAFWIAVALLVGGAGAFSVDRLLRRPTRGLAR
jgi:putative oxidoreductase